MMMWGFGWTDWLWMLAGLALIVGAVLIVVWAVQRAGGGAEDEPARILRARFARGEIDAAQFEEMRRVLGPTERPGARDRVGLIGLILVVSAFLAWIIASALGPAGGTPGRSAGPTETPSAAPTESPVVTACSPDATMIKIKETAHLTMIPDTISVTKGERVCFVVTNTAGFIHNFFVGPAADIEAHHQTDQVAGTHDFSSGTQTFEYRFSGSGPYEYACWVVGHLEAGMKGTVNLP